MRVVSSADGKPIEGARFMRMLNGKRRPIDTSDSDGELETSIPGDELGCVVAHPFFQDLGLGPLQVRRGGAQDLGEVALDPLLRVEVQCFDSEGGPLQERHKVRWIDAALGERWARTGRDGRCVLGVSEPPDSLFVTHPESRWRISPELPLVAEGSPLRWTCQVPDFTQVRIEVEGLPAAARAAFSPIFIKRDDDARCRTWNAKEWEGRLIFEEWLPPGQYELLSGWIIQVEPTHFEVPHHRDGEPMVLRVAGSGLR